MLSMWFYWLPDLSKRLIAAQKSFLTHWPHPTVHLNNTLPKQYVPGSAAYRSTSPIGKNVMAYSFLSRLHARCCTLVRVSKSLMSYGEERGAWNSGIGACRLIMNYNTSDQNLERKKILVGYRNLSLLSPFPLSLCVSLCLSLFLCFSVAFPRSNFGF